MRILRLFIAALSFSLLAGCFSNYYEVKDPGSDKTYYTNKIKENREGSISFSDATTGANVTIQNSEVREIKKDEFKAAVPND
jgi:hypothetical protein